jgi:hypothetical protein
MRSLWCAVALLCFCWASVARAEPMGLDLDQTGGLTPEIISPTAVPHVAEVFGDFSIVLTINDPGGHASPAITQAFANAELFWESKIDGYRHAEVGVISNLFITANFIAIDGAGGTLGEAAVTSALFRSNFVTPTRGFINFDVADLQDSVKNDFFETIVLHEMAHAIGFSSVLWDLNGAVSGNADTTYTGVRGLDQYSVEFDPTATFVPLEENGGAGTAYTHWDEELFLNHLAVNGNSANPELMTGFLDGSDVTISQTTLASFEYIG